MVRSNCDAARKSSSRHCRSFFGRSFFSSSSSSSSSPSSWLVVVAVAVFFLLESAFACFFANAKMFYSMRCDLNRSKTETNRTKSTRREHNSAHVKRLYFNSAWILEFGVQIKHSGTPTSANRSQCSRLLLSMLATVSISTSFAVVSHFSPQLLFSRYLRFEIRYYYVIWSEKYL